MGVDVQKEGKRLSSATDCCVVYINFKERQKMDLDGMLITQSNLYKLKNTDFISFNTKKYWHKFIFENGGLFIKEDVLQATLRAIYPFDLVPVKYTVIGKDSYFIARNCGRAIEQFCLNSLRPIKVKDDQSDTINMSIQTCCMPVEEFQLNMQLHLKKAIMKRYESCPKGCIDLSDFHREPELYEVIYCPLSIPRFLVYVLTIIQRILAVHSIILSHNGIECLIPIEFLHQFKGLLRLDLSHNKIKDIRFVEQLGQALVSLQEINLNGNPICDVFQTDIEYVQCIKKHIPSISKLDGIMVFKGMPNHQAWLCCNKASGIVNEFLKHYFTLYDSDRKALEHTYDRNAIFSMKSNQLNFQNFKAYPLERYQKTSCHKNTSIAKVLGELPSTQHDPFSFKVDVLLFKESNLVLVVSGVFKDFQDKSNIRSFNRTFVLKKVATYEYKITNDLYHVTEATSDQILVSFQKFVHILLAPKFIESKILPKDD